MAGRDSGRALAAAALALLTAACERAQSTLALPAAPVAAQEPARPHAPSLSVAGLRCEHHDEPLALDTSAPRFSWKLAALDPARRGLAQSAYRVLVASSDALLAEGRGDLWDSGDVSTNETVDVVYAGRTLRSFERLAWKVQVRDQDGVASQWSAPAHFGMGVLDPADWQARWIGFDAPLAAVRAVPGLGAAGWIRAAGGEREIVLRRRFELAGAAGANAVLVLAAVDEFEVFLNGQQVKKGSATTGVRRNAEIVKVSRHLQPGTNLLAARVRTAGSAPAALSCRLLLDPDVAGSMELVTDAAWSAALGAPNGWERAGPDDALGPPAIVLGAEEEAALAEVDSPAPFLPPPRLLRGTFRAKERPARATLYASALGVYSLELDGERAHDDWFAPGWTDYRKRIPYRGYDVTALVRAGENALGVVLADGWYSGLLGKGGQRNHYGDKPRFLGQLVLDYADGTREIVTSDASWRAAVGPWREADLYMGERYDARAELAGWSAPGFDARTWSPVDVTERVAAPLVAHPGPEVRVIAELAPVSIQERAPDRWLFDFGQNMAGVARLAVAAPAGTALVLRFAEALEPDGSLMRRNLGWARAADQYVCKGGGSAGELESWRPRFTYHGFRYVEVAGLTATPAKTTLTALALSSATRDAGDFRCSDPLVNKLVENARWTLRSNSMDIPTDSPQRGERLGWTGDAQLFAPSALWLADLQTLYDKWCLDLLDAQRADGRFPNTAPGFEGMPNGGPAWEDAGVLVPALLYDVYGDTRLVERQYESMARFLSTYERRSAPDRGLPRELEGFGDWHELGATTPKEVLYLAYYARCARRMTETARALGREADAARYAALAARVSASFADHFVDAEGRVRGETQAAYALALREDLVPAERRARAAARFAEDVEQSGGRLTTGFVGTPELLPSLSAIGRHDLAYRLLGGRALPSWGYMIDQGATTLWERWDAWTPEGGFANHGNVSLVHGPLGSVIAWLFETVAGIRPAKPGFRSVTLAPVPGGGLSWAEANYDSARGRIALRWELAESQLRIGLTIPPNVAATLRIGTSAPESVTESGRGLDGVPGARVERNRPEGLFVHLEAGSYSFTCNQPSLAR
jgi:alpha-L-rhamnosidase